MHIRFVEHASILVEAQKQRILCDPWLKGKVFNNGWALVSPSYQPDFSAIDYIWISHEHPDHFNFPSLKSIPDADKARIKILHQRHASPRMAEALAKFGFAQVIELPLYKWIQLSDGLEIFCGSVGSMDSFIAFRDQDECLLNINDCVLNIDQLRYIKRRIGKVSGLFTQFSFANWVGNEGDEIHGAARKIEQFKQQIDIFQPEFTVPFASFVYFCNEENSRMNAWANTPDTIAQLKLDGVNFMYPGDEWDSATRTFDSETALAKYRADYANITIDSTPEAVDIAKISQAIEQNLKEIKAKAPRSLFKKIEPFSLFIHDLDKVIDVNVVEGTYHIVDADAKLRQTARFVVCSQVAWFLFAFSFGGNTMQISGMFLDRDFATKGPNAFFTVQNIVSTEVLRSNSTKAKLRTARFFWEKKWEMFYRFTASLRGRGEPDADD